MRLSRLVLPLAAIALAPVAAHAETEQPADQQAASEPSGPDYIAFANHRGVRDFQAEGNDTIYFEDQHKRWFKAVLTRPSFDLPFTLFIGLDTGPSGRLDRWSAVYISGERYTFHSFERVSGPPPKKNKDKKDKDEAKSED